MGEAANVACVRNSGRTTRARHATAAVRKKRPFVSEEDEEEDEEDDGTDRFVRAVAVAGGGRDDDVVAMREVLVFYSGGILSGDDRITERVVPPLNVARAKGPCRCADERYKCRRDAEDREPSGANSANRAVEYILQG
ncbi:hypothetical protein SPI_08463 [Niveomyces insectorum RCEF 264]|uniref:Uncharacterized protein n=1 Tax=Niveomyces insectorum RCEF 264 TaxID=1081102 RepID=A0A167MZV8_9HYPO|nr:hypothetical protein SPI_08463 [Niveomyces insectorum RCEF 264]